MYRKSALQALLEIKIQNEYSNTNELFIIDGNFTDWMYLCYSFEFLLTTTVFFKSVGEFKLYEIEIFGLHDNHSKLSKC